MDFIMSKFGLLKTKVPQLLGYVFVFVSTVILSIGCSISFSGQSDFGSKMANVIRGNNRSDEFGSTYWRCEPIETRYDWLGWGAKTYIASLANPWAVYGNQSDNNCFFYTDWALGQTFIMNDETGESVPVSIFSSPSTRSISCFDVKLKDGKTPDTKYEFYCSAALADFLGDAQNECNLIVRTNGEKVTPISFDGVVDDFGYDLISELAARSQYYIVIPYMIRGGDIISYDMQNYTGQSSLFAVMKNDMYENNYYSLMIRNIYSMGGVQNQLCYKATYIDNFSEILSKYDDIESDVQASFLELSAGSGSVSRSSLAIGVALTVVGFAALLALAIKPHNKIYVMNIFNIVFGAATALVIFWLIGEAAYNSALSALLFWDIRGRVLVFYIVAALAIIMAIYVSFSRKNRKKHNIDNQKIEYYSMDV